MKFISIFSKKRIYADYASITPVDPRVISVMSKTMKTVSANPSSLYTEGVQAKKLMESCRAQVAQSLEAHPDEIVFTSGGTEANNLALKGVVETALKQGIAHPHVVITAIEHPSVLEIVHWMKEKGVEVTIVPVLENGIVDPKDIRAVLKNETILVSVMYVNNEIGTIQPISDIAKAIRHFKKEKRDNVEAKGNREVVSEGTQRKSQTFAYPLFHTDASQAVVYCSLRVPALWVDLMTLDGSKFYGPRSSGCLYVKRGVELMPQIVGGTQEHGMRAGTENVPMIVGFTEALNIVQKEKSKKNTDHSAHYDAPSKEYTRISELRDYLWTEIQKISTQKNVGITQNGDPTNRLPNNLNICIPGSDAEFLVLKLDARGVAVSSVTSCRNLSEDSTSYVIESLGKSDCAKSSLRITLGRFTTKAEVKQIVKILTDVL